MSVERTNSSCFLLMVTWVAFVAQRLSVGLRVGKLKGRGFDSHQGSECFLHTSAAQMALLMGAAKASVQLAPL